MNKQLSKPRKYDVSAIDRANLAETTRYKYKRELNKYLDAGHQLGDYKALTDYAADLTSSRRAFLKAAVRLVIKEYENELKSSATPENIGAIQAGVFRLEALNEAVKVKTSKGKKAHFWLKPDEVKRMMAATETNQDELTYLRDWVILGLLVGAGLRREELVNLRFEDVTSIPNGKGDRDVINVFGKGAKNRVVPIKSRLAEKIEEWRIMINAEPGDLIARSLGRGKKLSDSMSAVAVFHLVNKYGKLIGKPELAPHDLRRTYAQLGYGAGVDVAQISMLLGHASIATTQKYLDLSLDLHITASDFIPL